VENSPSKRESGEAKVDVLARDVTFAALAESLAAQTLRQQLIAQNIANVNTPDYQRRDVSFSDELVQALAEPGTRTERVANVLNTVAREVVEERLFYRADLGGVDLDREMTEQAKTTLMHAALAQLTQQKIRQYRQVIKEGRV